MKITNRITLHLGNRCHLYKNIMNDNEYLLYSLIINPKFHIKLHWDQYLLIKSYNSFLILFKLSSL